LIKTLCLHFYTYILKDLVSIRTQGNTKYVGMRHALLDTVDWEVKIKIKLVNTSRLPTNGYKSGVGNLFSVAGSIEVSLVPSGHTL